MNLLLVLAQVDVGAPWAGSRRPEYLELARRGLISEQPHCGGFAWRPTELGRKTLRAASAALLIVRQAMRLGPVPAERLAA